MHQRDVKAHLNSHVLAHSKCYILLVIIYNHICNVNIAVTSLAMPFIDAFY